jgi:hypothetical protein
VAAAAAVVIVATLAALALLLGRDAVRPPPPPPEGLQVRTDLEPTQPLFGDRVVAVVEVLVDTTRVDPRTIRLDERFAPYRSEGQTRTLRSFGDVAILRVEDTLHCLDGPCIPGRTAPLVLHFPRVQATASGLSADASWPALGVRSRLVGRDLQEPFLRIGAPRPAAVHYRVAPRRTGTALLALAALAGLAGLLLLGRLAVAPLLDARRRRVTRLERILGELGSASQNGSAARRRAALEELAHELEHVDGDLSRRSRALAWSPDDPERDEIAELTRRVHEGPSA